MTTEFPTWTNVASADMRVLIEVCLYHLTSWPALGHSAPVTEADLSNFVQVAHAVAMLRYFQTLKQ